MRTTITIDDELYRRVKATAARQGRTVGAVIEDALRAEARHRPQPGEVPPLPTFAGTGLLPGVDLSSTAALLETMGQGTAPDALR